MVVSGALLVGAKWTRNVVCVKYLFRESPGEKGKMRKHDFYPKLKLKGHKNGAII